MLQRDRLSLSLFPTIRTVGKVFFRSVSDSLGTGVFARLWKAALIIWGSVLILTPIGLWIGGEDLFPTFAMLGVLAQVTVVLLSLAITYPLSRVVTIAATVLLATWGIEALGSATGFPFGHYVYTSKLQPQSGGVPWLIPFAWLMMLPPAWAVRNPLDQFCRLVVEFCNPDLDYPPTQTIPPPPINNLHIDLGISSHRIRPLLGSARSSLGGFFRDGRLCL